MFTGILGKSELQRSCLGKSGRPRNERTVLEEATTMMMTRWIFEHQKTTSYIGRVENERHAGHMGYCFKPEKAYG